MLLLHLVSFRKALFFLKGTKNVRRTPSGHESESGYRPECKKEGNHGREFWRGRHREVGSEGNVDQSRGLTDRNRASAGRAVKAVELTSGGLRRVS